MASRNKLYKRSDWNRRAAINPGSTLPPEDYRHPARRDFARLIHSPSFRRLQGKTQLFPSSENDFFRNRLTHSLEVAQVAKSIAIRINNEFELFKKNPINTDLVEFAALAHDLGHPPFGHNGEQALDELMKNNGGFEGNAQTLRILSRLEKKETMSYPSKSTLPEPISAGIDNRLGLNLTYRSLASILKYDTPIPNTKDERTRNNSDRHPAKGYYQTESDLVRTIKDNVAPGYKGEFKTIECSIMDIADDIAYSTYDIEDSFKAGFLSPLTLIAAPDAAKEKIVEKVIDRLNKYYPDISAEMRGFSVNDLNSVLLNVFDEIFDLPPSTLDRLNDGLSVDEFTYAVAGRSVGVSREIAQNGYFRNAFTSDLVGTFVRSVELVPNSAAPQLTKARLEINTFKVVETLKAFAFDNLIDSPRLKIAEQRGKEIIGKLFHAFLNKPMLLPEDWQEIFHGIDDAAWKERVICDYISSMTDRYCVEMYKRLTGHDLMTIYKPH